MRRSKLHFVDLAGSERVGKTGLAAHAQLREAKYINLSLHFLEQVWRRTTRSLAEAEGSGLLASNLHIAFVMPAPPAHESACQHTTTPLAAPLLPLPLLLLPPCMPQVIISLQEGRPHVPYRNSVLTMALRDSLGGNTRTVMVAAVAPEAQHIEESISTCRFAQRVAMISNRCAGEGGRETQWGDCGGGGGCAVVVRVVCASRVCCRLQRCRTCHRWRPSLQSSPPACRVEVNEELDLEVLVRRLKQENALLRQELQLLRGTGGANRGGIGGIGGEAAERAGVADVTAGSTEGGSGGSNSSTGSSGGIERRQALSEEEQRRLRRQVQAFVEDPAPDAILNVEASVLFIRSAFDILKALARQAGPAGLQRLTSAAAAAGGGDGDVAEAAAELGSLRLLVQQQEQQIGVLAGVLRTQGLAAPANPQHSRQGSGGGSIGAAISQPVTSSSGWPQQRPGSSAGAPNTAILLAFTPYSDELLADQHKAVSAAPLLRQPVGLARSHCCMCNQPFAVFLLPCRLCLPPPLPQFEYFCATSPAHVAVAAHKAVLRSKYEEARALGSRVAASKQRISELKSTVEQRRLARSMAALLRQQQAGGGRDSSGSGERQEGEERQQHDAEEEQAKSLIEKVTACLPALCKLAAAAKLLLLSFQPWPIRALLLSVSAPALCTVPVSQTCPQCPACCTAGEGYLSRGVQPAARHQGGD